MQIDLSKTIYQIWLSSEKMKFTEIILNNIKVTC